MAGFLEGIVNMISGQSKKYKMDKSIKTYLKLKKEMDSFIKKHNFENFKPNVGVFGENSTGKSTFLNALLGNKDQFKMGFGETTDKITALYSGKAPHKFKNIETSHLINDYDHLKFMHIYDIPGFGQKFSHGILSSVLKRMDIVFWFINASSGIKAEDKKFLELLKGNSTRVIVIYNKIDTIGENIGYEKYINEVESEIKKIKTLFKEESLSNNLVTIFPFSATKSLVGMIKGQKGVFSAVDKIVQDILLYVVFLESYRSYIDFVTRNNNEYYIDNDEFMNEIKLLCYEVNRSLEKKLKNEISILDSINPWSSKDEKAKPIINNFKGKLGAKVNEKINDLYCDIVENIKETEFEINSYSVFSGTKLSLPAIKVDPIRINIDLDDIAWSNLFGDSFAEEVAIEFCSEAMTILNDEVPPILDRYESMQNKSLLSIMENSKHFSLKLDKKVLKMSEEIQGLVLYLMVGALQNKLTDDDNIMIGKIISS